MIGRPAAPHSHDVAVDPSAHVKSRHTPLPVAWHGMVTSRAEAVAEAFVRLHDKGLIYRGSYMVNWSPALLTAVSDLEVEYSEEPGFLYFFK
jgi:hypothetical protein